MVTSVLYRRVRPLIVRGYKKHRKRVAGPLRYDDVSFGATFKGHSPDSFRGFSYGVPLAVSEQHPDTTVGDPPRFGSRMNLTEKP